MGRKFLIAFVLWIAFAFSFLQSITVTSRLVERRIARRSPGMVVDQIIAGMDIRLLPLLFDIPAGMPHLLPAGE